MCLIGLGRRGVWAASAFAGGDAVAAWGVSPFVVVLSEQERTELQRRAGCYIKPYAVVVRRIVVTGLIDSETHWLGEPPYRRRHSGVTSPSILPST